MFMQSKSYIPLLVLVGSDNSSDKHLIRAKVSNDPFGALAKVKADNDEKIIKRFLVKTFLVNFIFMHNKSCIALLVLTNI